MPGATPPSRLARRRAGIGFLLLLLLLAAAGAARAQDHQLPAAWLRIETGGHTAKSATAATDAEGRVLVTGSEDKTVRAWSLPDLRPLAVLRPPGGPAEQGQVHAVAVSPDARLVAVGGWIGATDTELLVFDLLSREVALRIPGLPDVVTALAISPDGERLAAGLGGGRGVRLWRLADGRPLAEDTEYGGSVQGLAFAPDGRLAATALDGRIRLYDAAGRRLARAAAEAGRLPAQPAFAPDGEALAIGFEDAVALEIRDARSLLLRARPDVAGMPGAGLNRVAWSRDGRVLMAGGDAWSGGSRPVHGWAEGGRGARRLLARGFAAGVAAILPLPGGRVALTSKAGDIALADPADPEGRGRPERRAEGGGMATPVDPAAPARRLRLSRDGTVAEWTFSGARPRWLRFDARRAELSAGSAPTPGLADWSTQSGALRLDRWDQGAEPVLDGRGLALDPHERARSAAVAGDRALLGGSWSLRLFDAKARPVWRIAAPGAAWRVNISPDGRLAVAAFGDGTLRWYRMQDGAELLALFVTGDGRRWVAFTPSGYYATSAGGEGLVGWQVNNGEGRAADFFPASHFRARFYHPDVVSNVLDTLDEAEAVRRAGLGPRPAGPPVEDRPPVVAIRAPRDGTPVEGDAVALEVEIRSPADRPVTRLDVRLDMRPAPQALVGPPLPAASPAPGLERRHVLVPLPQGALPEIQVIAWSGERVSEPVSLRLRRPAATAAPAPDPPNRPRLHALLVGVSDYRDPGLRLNFAAKDAEDLAGALRRQAGPGRLYREASVSIIPQAQATREEILQGLVELQRSVTQRDVALVFLAGHGIADEGEYYFLPVDADRDMPSVRGVSGVELRRHLGRIQGKTIALLDTCHAALVAQPGVTHRSLPPDLTRLVNELAAPDVGVAVYSATAARQLAAERAELRNGVFTYALLEILDGRSGMPGGETLRLNSLASLLSERVRDLSGGRQTSIYSQLTPLPDLPILMAVRAARGG